MLCIENIRFLSKIEGLMDRINNPEVSIKIVIENTFELPLMKGRTKGSSTDWEEHTIPPIQIAQSQKQYPIQFAIYREGGLLGTGATSFSFKQSRKDCLDVVDQENRLNGRLIYELIWVSRAKDGQYITADQYTNAKVKGQLKGGKQLLIQRQVVTDKQKERKYVRQQGDENCGGFCGCFAVRKKKKLPISERQQQLRKTQDQIRQTPVAQKVYAPAPAPVPITAPLKFQIKSEPQKKEPQSYVYNPYIYYEQQLEAKIPNEELKINRLQFYSKKIATCK